jgi:SH3-like domain-containing protein
MKTTSCAAIFILCAFLPLLPVGANPASPPGLTDRIQIVPCDVRAYVLDGTPGGTNVRSGPGKTYKAIENLPNHKVEGIEVHITGASGEWVRIDKAVEEGGDPDRVLFQGKGWIYARLLGAGGKSITNGGTNLYLDKSTRSSVTSWVSVDDSITVRGCDGQWMFVAHKKKKGWAAPGTLCPNSLTTCV